MYICIEFYGIGIHFYHRENRERGKKKNFPIVYVCACASQATKGSLAFASRIFHSAIFENRFNVDETNIVRYEVGR